MRSVDEWKSALREALKEAMRARQAHTVAVLRETLAAFDNAEAVDAMLAPPEENGVIAGGVVGLGAGEVARRALEPAEVAAIIEREMEERRAAAAEYEALGRDTEARILRQQVETLTRLA